MPRVLCIANQKGGVGKTTTAVNLAVALAKAGNRTLLVDFDPQSNATSGLGASPVDAHPLAIGRPLRESVAETQTAGLDLARGCRSVRDVEVLASSETDVSTIVPQLTAAAAGYDYVLFDCPPSLGRLTELALVASDEVLMPIQCEFFAMEGLAQMIDVIRRVMQRRPGRLGFAGIVLTMYDDALELTREVDAEVREFFGEIVFQTVIPRDVAVAEAPSHGRSVLDHAPRSRGARAYVELCLEVLGRE